jgi:hypothetical protein
MGSGFRCVSVGHFDALGSETLNVRQHLRVLGDHMKHCKGSFAQ